MNPNSRPPPLPPRHRRHYLVISEINIIVAADNEPHCWEVDLILDGEPYRNNLIIVDPFDDDAATSCKWYLEKYAAESPLERGRAEKIDASLRRYAHQLSQQLHLQHFGQVKRHHGTIRTLVIDVIDMHRPLGLSSNSIHRLHWELLESEFLWSKSFNKVIVQRRATQELHTLSIDSQLSALQLNTKKSTFNVLIVMARNLSRDSSSYQDVDPFLGYRALTSVRQALKKSRPLDRLEIEVVRPGTFDAFRKHLDVSLRENGPDHFDMIHFDLHGRLAIQKSDKQKVAWLLFKKPNQSAALHPIPAAAVVECLREHRIKLAVFNSCNSATSNAGLNANLAGLLAAKGIPGVLAMSFKLLNTTATSFLLKFYEELFLRRANFAEAAALARASLRANPERGARFGLKIDVKDWIIPIVYTHGEDFQVFSSTENVYAASAPPRRVDTTIQSDELNMPTTLVGRDLEILRFEDTLIASKILHLYGAPGLGKTAFLREIAQSWVGTGFTEQLVSLTQPALNFADFIKAVASSLETRDGKIYPSNTSSTQHIEIEPLLQQLSSKSTVLIFDHVNQLQFRNFARQLDQTYIRNLANFLHELLKRNNENPQSHPLYMIFVGYNTTEYIQWWDQNFEMLDATSIMFTTLDLPAVISFSDLILKEKGSNGAWRKGREVDGLVQLIELLQRNPLSLRLVLADFVRTGLSLGAFTHQLLVGELNLARLLVDEDVASSRSHLVQLLLVTLRNLRQSRSIEWLCAIGLFWNQGPEKFPEFSARLRSEFDRLPQSELVRPRNEPLTVDNGLMSFMILNEVYAFRCDATSLAWIHPLLSVMLRKLLQERISQQSPQWIRTLYLCFVRAMDDRIAQHYPTEQWNISDDQKDILARTLQKHLPNILFAMHLCCQESPVINLNEWPLSFSAVFGLAARWPASVKTQMSTLLDSMIQRFFKLNGSFSVIEPKQELFILSAIAFSLTLSGDMTSQTLDSNFYKIRCAVQVMKPRTALSDGQRPAVQLQWIKISLWEAASIAHLTRGMLEKADYAWQEHHRITKQTGILPAQSVEDLLDELLGDWSPTKIDLVSCVAKACTVGRVIEPTTTRNDLELDLVLGQIVMVVGPHSADWYEGISQGRVGYFEADRVDFNTSLTEAEVLQNQQDLEKALFVVPRRARVTTVRLPSNLRSGDIIHLLGPVDPDTWSAWCHGSVMIVKISDIEVDSPDSEPLQLNRLADETLDALELGIAWEWIRKRMTRDPNEKTREFPIPAMRKYLAFKYNILYRDYMGNDSSLARQHAFQRALLGDLPLYHSLSAMIENKRDITEELRGLEKAVDSGAWESARKTRHRLADLAAQQGDYPAHIYHVKKLIEIYDGVSGSQETVRRLTVQARVSRMRACETYVHHAPSTSSESREIDTFKQALENGNLWLERYLTATEHDAADPTLSLDEQEKWMDAYEPASSFDINIEFREDN